MKTQLLTCLSHECDLISDCSFLQVDTLVKLKDVRVLKHLLAPGQIHQVKFPAELLLGLHVLLLDVDEEYAVAP